MANKHIEGTILDLGPRECAAQMYRVSTAIEKWLTVTDVQNIKKKIPKVSNEAKSEERDEAVAEQMRKNAFAVLDVVLGEHRDETLELLAMLCNIEPKELDEYPTRELMRCINELLNDKDFVGFFVSCVQLARMNFGG